MKNGLAGVSTAVILESLYKNSGGILFAKSIDEQHFRVDAIVMANKTTHETYDDHGRGGGKACRSSGGL